MGRICTFLNITANYYKFPKINISIIKLIITTAIIQYIRTRLVFMTPCCFLFLPPTLQASMGLKLVRVLMGRHPSLYMIGVDGLLLFVKVHFGRDDFTAVIEEANNVLTHETISEEQSDEVAQ